MQNSKKRSIIFFIIIGILFLSLYFFIIPLKDWSYINFFGLLGSFLTMYGIGITYLQIMSVKRQTEEVNSSIKDAKSLFTKVFSLTDISKAIKLVDEIQTYVSEKLESAWIRLKDLKVILAQIEEAGLILKDANRSLFQRARQKLTEDLINLDAKLQHESSIDLIIINANLEHLNTLLIQIESQIKLNI